MGFRLSHKQVSESKLALLTVTKQMWVGPFRVPTCLMMTADGHSRCHDSGDGEGPEGWHVTVSVVMPLLGEIVKYDGDVYCT